MKIEQDPRVPEKFESYPESVRPHLNRLRSLILETAEASNIDRLEETLKWGEPSYIAKKGSTIRIDWKEKQPEQFAMYFSCSTTLVSTFRTVYGDVFHFEKNRALLFDLGAELPTPELKNCIRAALEYKLRKDQPMLGM